MRSIMRFGALCVTFLGRIVLSRAQWCCSADTDCMKGLDEAQAVSSLLVLEHSVQSRLSVHCFVCGVCVVPPFLAGCRTCVGCHAVRVTREVLGVCVPPFCSPMVLALREFLAFACGANVQSVSLTVGTESRRQPASSTTAAEGLAQIAAAKWLRITYVARQLSRSADCATNDACYFGKAADESNRKLKSVLPPLLCIL